MDMDLYGTMFEGADFDAENGRDLETSNSPLENQDTHETEQMKKLRNVSSDIESKQNKALADGEFYTNKISYKEIEPFTKI